MSKGTIDQFLRQDVSNDSDILLRRVVLTVIWQQVRGHRIAAAGTVDGGVKHFNNNTKNSRALVLLICVEKFGCTKDIWINRAHPLHDRIAIIPHIPMDSDIEYIMGRGKSLKGTNSVVHRDFPLEVRRNAHICLRCEMR
ncbi:hypothetical protein J6590_087659 [Homalodisca vitripennis]|nr:hypothetical protein J6590_087659 [Homalodisca vitripennis]